MKSYIDFLCCDLVNKEDIFVCLFISRNKDNKNIPDFIERRKVFITNKHFNDSKLLADFRNFVDNGMINENCRMYYSLNSRKNEMVYKRLLYFLIDEPNCNLCSLQSKIASIAAKPECAKTKYWFFDFDINDTDKVDEFIEDIYNIDSNVNVFYRKTPNGYAIITNRGFDARELQKKWAKDVSLKKDDLLCVHWSRKTDKGIIDET